MLLGGFNDTIRSDAVSTVVSFADYGERELGIIA
jgi:hypothetical protein